MQLVLASASPRRHDLLIAAGLPHVVESVDVDERRALAEPAAVYVDRVARLKAGAGAARHPEATVIGADTVVVLDGDVFGKPIDVADARRMLRELSGRAHEVLTGVAIARGGQVHARVATTTVWFTTLSAEDVEWYVASGEPMGKAGAYAIQGLASRFIPRIDGSYANVVGLPVAVVAEMLGDGGVRWRYNS